MKPIENFEEHISDNIEEPLEFVSIFDDVSTASPLSLANAPKARKKAASVSHTSLKKKKRRHRNRRQRRALTIFFSLMLGFSIAAIIFILWLRHEDALRLNTQMTALREIKEQASSESLTDSAPGTSSDALLSEIPLNDIPEEDPWQLTPALILPEYQALYEINTDMVGWLSIKGTCIDYPVMQTKSDESYYLHRNFYKENDKNGCLLVDDGSTVGIATKKSKYAYLQDGMTLSERPSTNIIIHGHTMSSGDMFGNLNLYKDEAYGKEHNIICFDSLYEHREYELLAVFYSKVYKKNDTVFKYYQFFEAYSPEQFYDWYYGIRDLSLYDTGKTAVFGDEFITLSCCAYHTKNGRFVVVGKRIL